MKARRGDLVAVVAERHDYIIGQERKPRTTVELAVVTSVTRDGIVKLVRHAWQSDDHKGVKLYPWESVRVVSKDTIDVAQAIEIARSHHWPTTGAGVMPFDSVDECREAIRPALRERAA